MPGRSRRARALVGAMLALLGVASACKRDPYWMREEARSLQDEGRFEESLDPLRVQIEATPDDPETYHLLGLGLLRSGRPSQAIWPLLRASESDTFAAESGRVLAALQLDARNFQEAARSASRVLMAAPDDAGALALRGRARLQGGEPEAALADAERMLDASPAALAALTLRAAALADLERFDEADDAYTELAQSAIAAGNESVAGRACLTQAAYLATQHPDEDRTRAVIDDCAARFGAEAELLPALTALLDRTGKREEATALWREAMARDPQQLGIRATLASRLERAGEMEKAGALWMATAELVDDAAAWQLLASFQQRRGNAAEARAALARAIERSDGGVERLRFTEADLLIDLGKLDEAAAVAAVLDDPTLRQLLEGRILAQSGDAKGALALLGPAIEAWPDNPGARVLAAQAAEAVGDVERAVSEYRAAFRAGRGTTDAALAAARLHLQMGEPESALMLLRHHLSARREADAEPYLLMSRAYAALGDLRLAGQALGPLERIEGAERVLIQERASLAAREHGPARAVALLAESGTDWADPENELLLASYVSQLVAAGDASRALAVLDAAMKSAAPERAMPYDLRGRILLGVGRGAEARHAFERALEIDPASGRARVGLATVLAAQGSRDAAVALLDARVATSWQLSASDHRQAARIYATAGRMADARVHLEAALRLAPGDPALCSELARRLARDGVELERAEALAERAVRLAPGEATQRTLAYVRERRRPHTD